MSNKLREIYSFFTNKEVEEEIKKETENGTLVTKEKVSKPIKIIFKKPTRFESEEADTISAVEYADSVRKGILTKPLLEKLYDEKGGFLVDDYAKKYNDLLGEFFELETEFQTLNFKENKTSEDNQRLKELAASFIKAQDSLQSVEGARNSLFQNTAETRARNKTIFWLTLFLTYIGGEEDKDPTPLFTGKTFEEKISEYDKAIEDNDLFVFRVIEKMSLFVTLWYLGKASTVEDFSKIEENLNTKNEEIENNTELKKEEILETENKKEEIPLFEEKIVKTKKNQKDEQGKE